LALDAAAALARLRAIREAEVDVDAEPRSGAQAGAWA
jgi:hypothetical protein